MDSKDVKNFLFYLPKITLFVFTATALNHVVPAVMPCLLFPVTKMACPLVPHTSIQEVPNRIERI
jgi:hypothetical protein